MKTRIPAILYEDDVIVAFDKPGGVLVAPDRSDTSLANLMDVIHKRLAAAYAEVHRMDRDVSGVLLCAKKRSDRVKLCRLIESRRTTKQYLAMVRGWPAEASGTVDLALIPDEHNPGRMRTSPRGRRAETRYEVEERWRGYALLRVTPLTNHPHQIRVHLASLGCPIVADRLYGGGEGVRLSELKPGYRFKEDRPEYPLLRRLGLHAESLSFVHPVTGLEISIHAPLPKDFAVAIKYLRLYTPSGAKPAGGL